jgi:hypothetical protein
MAVIVATSDPSGLLQAIYAAIDKKQVETWSYDKDGDFTHVPPQWKNKAWMRPEVSEGELRFGIIGPRNVTMSKLVYAVYHGRFIEMLLDHFDTKFSSAEASAQQMDPDTF